jgi:hypothetical protein
MQRLYIWIIIAAVVFAASYSKTIKNFFAPEEAAVETAQPAPSSKQEDSYEQRGAELYAMAASFQNLQGKAELLKIAKEKREWFKQEDYARLDTLLEATQKELAKAEVEFQKAKDEYTRLTVQKMLEDSTAPDQQKQD